MLQLRKLLLSSSVVLAEIHHRKIAGRVATTNPYRCLLVFVEDVRATPEKSQRTRGVKGLDSILSVFILLPGNFRDVLGGLFCCHHSWGLVPFRGDETVCGCCGVVVVFVSPTMPNSNPPLVVVWLGTAVGHWQCAAIASRRSVVLVLCLVGTILLAAYLLACVVIAAALS